MVRHVSDLSWRVANLNGKLERHKSSEAIERRGSKSSLTVPPIILGGMSAVKVDSNDDCTNVASQDTTNNSLMYVMCTFFGPSERRRLCELGSMELIVTFTTTCSTAFVVNQHLFSLTEAKALKFAVSKSSTKLSSTATKVPVPQLQFQTFH